MYLIFTIKYIYCQKITFDMYLIIGSANYEIPCVEGGAYLSILHLYRV